MLTVFLLLTTLIFVALATIWNRNDLGNALIKVFLGCMSLYGLVMLLMNLGFILHK